MLTKEQSHHSPNRLIKLGSEYSSPYQLIVTSVSARWK